MTDYPTGGDQQIGVRSINEPGLNSGGGGTIW